LGPGDKSTHDDVQNLANSLGIDIHIGSDGFLRIDKSEAISSERHGHKETTKGILGGCGQHEDNLPNKN